MGGYGGYSMFTYIFKMVDFVWYLDFFVHISYMDPSLGYLLPTLPAQIIG